MKQFLVLAALGLASVSAHAGFAPADNPTITVFDLTGGTRLTTDFDHRDVLSCTVKGRVQWTLDAKNTPASTFDDATTHILPDGRSFWVRGEKGLDVRDLATGSRRFRATLSDAPVQEQQLAVWESSPDGTRVAIGGGVKAQDKWTDHARVFDLRSGRALQDVALSGFPQELAWTSATRIEVKHMNDAAYDAHGNYIPGKPKKLSQEFDVPMAPVSFVPARLTPAGAQRVATKTTRRKTHRAGQKRRLRR